MTEAKQIKMGGVNDNIMGHCFCLGLRFLECRYSIKEFFFMSDNKKTVISLMILDNKQIITNCKSIVIILLSHIFEYLINIIGKIIDSRSKLYIYVYDMSM